MRWQVEFAAWWDVDLNLRAARYAEQDGDELAERFVNAVEATIKTLAENPHFGRRPYPNDSDVADFHSWLVKTPFHKHIVFYRFTDQVLILERLIHGARDLPWRLTEPPHATE